MKIKSFFLSSYDCVSFCLRLPKISNAQKQEYKPPPPGGVVLADILTEKQVQDALVFNTVSKYNGINLTISKKNTKPFEIKLVLR